MTNEEKVLFKAMIGNMSDLQLIELVTIVAETGTSCVMSFQLWKALKTHLETHVDEYHDQYSLVVEIEGIAGKHQAYLLEVVSDED